MKKKSQTLDMAGIWELPGYMLPTPKSDSFEPDLVPPYHQQQISEDMFSANDYLSNQSKLQRLLKKVNPKKNESFKDKKQKLLEEAREFKKSLRDEISETKKRRKDLQKVVKELESGKPGESSSQFLSPGEMEVPSLEKFKQQERELATKQKSKEKQLKDVEKNQKAIEDIDIPKSDASIKAFQQALSSSLPGVGKVYSGPIDGIFNPELKSTAIQIENYIGKMVGKPASGMLWNDQKNNFNTSVSDLKSALQTIQNQSKNQNPNS